MEKYKSIYENKKKKLKKKVYNFVFEKVLGKEKAQNIFPTTEEYIKVNTKTKCKM